MVLIMADRDIFGFILKISVSIIALLKVILEITILIKTIKENMFLIIGTIKEKTKNKRNKKKRS